MCRRHTPGMWWGPDICQGPPARSRSRVSPLARHPWSLEATSSPPGRHSCFQTSGKGRGWACIPGPRRQARRGLGSRTPRSRAGGREERLSPSGHNRNWTGRALSPPPLPSRGRNRATPEGCQTPRGRCRPARQSPPARTLQQVASCRSARRGSPWWRPLPRQGCWQLPIPGGPPPPPSTAGWTCRPGRRLQLRPSGMHPPSLRRRGADVFDSYMSW